MKVAVIWNRFGPYHVARLRGAAEVCKRYGMDVTGLEIAGRDSTYQWDVYEGAHGFERETIFPEANYDDLGERDIGAGVHAALERLRPDVVAINGWSVAEACAALDWCGRNKRVRAVLMSETKEDDAKRSWWKERVKAKRIACFGAALVGGQHHRDYLQKLGFDGERVFLGYDAVDNDYFARGSALARKSANAVRDELSLPKNYFFACTRFLPRKNVAGLLMAYAAYRPTVIGEPWDLVVAGDGEEIRRLWQLEQDLKLEGVTWTGFAQYNVLPKYYGLASAFIHPARVEAWGLVVNEAAACGLPLVVSQTVGAASELVRDGDNGMLFDPHTDDGLVNAMIALSHKRQGELAQMGARSEEIVADWSPARFGKGLLQAIEAAGE